MSPQSLSRTKSVSRYYAHTSQPRAGSAFRALCTCRVYDSGAHQPNITGQQKSLKHLERAAVAFKTRQWESELHQASKTSTL